MLGRMRQLYEFFGLTSPEGQIRRIEVNWTT
jgi:hypothetical protein